MKDINSLVPALRLHLNLNYPDLEECYIEGYKAAATEGKEDANPYATGSKESNQWLEGWWDGFYLNEPLYALEEKTTGILEAANDGDFHENDHNFFIKLLELSGLA